MTVTTLAQTRKERYAQLLATLTPQELENVTVGAKAKQDQTFLAIWNRQQEAQDYPSYDNTQLDDMADYYYSIR